jgi:hypothetical protein
MIRGFEDLSIKKVKAASAAGQTAITSDIVDLQNFGGVLFLTTAGTITAGGVQSIKVEEGDNSALSDAADVSGLSITIADDDDNQSFVLDYRKKKRYARASITRATQNSAFGEIYAILYNPNLSPVNNNVTDTFTVDSNV